jgi:hypothetical protein
LVALNQANQAWSPKLNFEFTELLAHGMKEMNLSFTSEDGSK